MVAGQQVLDMEILIPVEGEFDILEGYALKKEFKLVNALYVRHDGNLNAKHLVEYPQGNLASECFNLR